MPRSIARIVALFAILLIALPLRAQGEPTKVEIVKLAKPATAYVEVPNVGSGSAFCIHPTGLFITNEHVVRGEKGEITLVLDSSLKTQRVLKAKVVRSDKALDLALLRVEYVKDIPSLTLGLIDGLVELSPVIAFGFPLGRGLSTDV